MQAIAACAQLVPVLCARFTFGELLRKHLKPGLHPNRLGPVVKTTGPIVAYSALSGAAVRAMSRSTGRLMREARREPAGSAKGSKCMSRPKVYVTRKLPQVALDKIAEVCDMEVWEGELPPPRDTILEKAKDCDGILSLLTDKMDAQLMDACPNLRVISNYAVGFDNIEVPAATARRIQVGNTPGVLTETTADLAFTLLMAAARRIAEADRFTRAGEWKTWGPMLLLGQDIHHATLGIVGLGRIGKEMAKRGKGFDMKLYYYDERRDEQAENDLGIEYKDLDSLIRESDFISLHVPLMDSTRHLIGDREFGMMKPTAILVNSARGPVVDQKALYDALKAGKIAGAGLDVFEVEPIDANDPLLTLDNVVVAPHIASGSIATRTKMALMAAENLIAGVHCEPIPYKANPEVDTDFRGCKAAG